MKAFKIIGKIFGIALNVLLIAVLIVNGWTIIARNLLGIQNPTFLGFASAVVETDSMNGDRPDSIAGNDMIFTLAKSEYEIDDVIMFETTKGVTVTHRIVGYDEEQEGFITRGDANNTEDDERVTTDRIVGEVISVIPGAGGAIKWLRTPMGLMIIGMALVLLIGIPLLFGKEED